MVLKAIKMEEKTLGIIIKRNEKSKNPSVWKIGRWGEESLLSSIKKGGSDGKASAYNVGDPGSIPGSKRSSGEGNGNPLQYSCLENPMDGGAW